HKIPEGERVPNVREAVMQRLGISNMDEVQRTLHCQYDPQCVRKCFSTVLGEIGWVNNSVKSSRHDPPLSLQPRLPADPAILYDMQGRSCSNQKTVSLNSAMMRSAPAVQPVSLFPRLPHPAIATQR